MIKKVGVIKSNVVKRPGVSYKTVKTTPKATTPQMERALIENFVSLQQVMTNLSAKFDNLANQISKLLELFEISAKTLSGKNINLGRDNGKVEKKLDDLIGQNKVIARGLTLMHDKFPEREPFQSPIPREQRMERPISTIKPLIKKKAKIKDYEKSISPKSSKFTEIHEE